MIYSCNGGRAKSLVQFKNVLRNFFIAGLILLLGFLLVHLISVLNSDTGFESFS